MAIPCVATDAGAARELIEDGASGRVVPCGDPAALADAMAELIASPLLRQSMGTAGRASVLSRFPVRRMVDRTEQLYRGCLGHADGVRVVMIPAGPAVPHAGAESSESPQVREHAPRPRVAPGERR
jgi:hypothetical protein